MSKILEYKLWAGMTTEDPTFSICYLKKKGWVKLNVCPFEITREVELELLKVTIASLEIFSCVKQHFVQLT